MLPVRDQQTLAKIAAAGFALWGGLHFLLAAVLFGIRLFGPADAFESVGIPADTSPHAKGLILQANVSLLAGSLTVLLLAIRVGWRTPTRAYWPMLGISTLFAFEVVAFELIPGYLPWQQVVPSILVWALAATVGAVAYASSRRTARDPVPRAQIPA